MDQKNSNAKVGNVVTQLKLDQVNAAPDVVWTYAPPERLNRLRLKQAPKTKKVKLRIRRRRGKLIKI